MNHVDCSTLNGRLATRLAETHKSLAQQKYLRWVQHYFSPLEDLYRLFVRACRAEQVPIFLTFPEFVYWVYQNTSQVRNSTTHRRERPRELILTLESLQSLEP
jgi:hypothetical protein